MAQQVETVMTDFGDDNVAQGLESAQNKKDAASSNLRAVASDPKAKTRMIITAGIVVAGVAFGAFNFMSSGNKAAGPVDVDTPPVKDSGTVGINDKVTPEYAKLLEMKNQQDAAKASESGQTHIDSIVPDTNGAKKPKEPELPDSWMAEIPPPPQQVQPKMPPVDAPVVAPVAPKPEFQPRTEIQNQMNSLMSSWSYKKHSVVSFKSGTDQGQTPVQVGQFGAQLSQSAGSGSQAVASNGTDVTGPYTVVRSGDVLHSVLMLEANSDSGGSVMAEIIHGQYKGGKLLGTFKRVDEKLTLEFNTLSLPYLDKSVTISAIAVDNNVFRKEIEGNVDHHYFERYGLPFMASFISGLGGAVANMGTTSTVNGTGSSTTTRPALNTGEKAMVAVGAAATQVSQDLRQEARRSITVTIPSGTPMGIMFMANAIIPDAAPQFSQ